MSEAWSSFPIPWGEGAADFGSWGSRQLSASSVVLAVYPSSPTAAGLMVSHQLKASDVQKWLSREVESPLPARHRQVVRVDRNPMPGSAVWVLGVSRPRKDFTETETRHAALVLRLLRQAFDRVEGPRMGRVLAATDGTLLDADPVTLARFAQAQAHWAALFSQIQSVWRQRWTSPPDGAPRDMVLNVDDQPTCLRIYAHGQAASEHWCIEMRRLDADDLPAVGEIDDARVAEAIGYLDDHYAQTPSLDEVADFTETSPFHFHRLFARHVGISPKHYVLRKQIQVAKWLLRATRTQIGQIAAETGFASHGHFTATFHRLVGQSPRDYREQA